MRGSQQALSQQLAGGSAEQITYLIPLLYLIRLGIPLDCVMAFLLCE